MRDDYEKTQIEVNAFSSALYRLYGLVRQETPAFTFGFDGARSHDLYLLPKGPARDGLRFSPSQHRESNHPSAKFPRKLETKGKHIKQPRVVDSIILNATDARAQP